jgi:hypothetical protein
MPLQLCYLTKRYVYALDVSLLCTVHEIIKRNMIGGSCSVHEENEKY